MKRKNYRNVWLAACFPKVETPAESIRAKFKGGHEADYTMKIFDSLVTDPSIEEIYSNETGELYFYITEDGKREITI